MNIIHDSRIFGRVSIKEKQAPRRIKLCLGVKKMTLSDESMMMKTLLFTDCGHLGMLMNHRSINRSNQGFFKFLFLLIKS